MVGGIVGLGSEVGKKGDDVGDISLRGGFVGFGARVGRGVGVRVGRGVLVAVGTGGEVGRGADVGLPPLYPTHPSGHTSKSA